MRRRRRKGAAAREGAVEGWHTQALALPPPPPVLGRVGN
jgi:hypothetical protein